LTDHETPAIVRRPALRDSERLGLPPVLVGHATPEVRRRVEIFQASVAELFEAWVARRRSPHTQRAYRQDVECFIEYMGFDWAAESWRMYTVSVKDVQAFREHLIMGQAAPKTLNRRISSLSSFYKFLAATAAELRLPITVPNPAHAQFISRESNDPLHETKALSATWARQLMNMPTGDSLVDARDRAILKFYLYSAARIGAGCRLKVNDFHRDGDEATIKLSEKGNRHRTIGLHFAAAEAIAEYIEKAGLTGGPLFRPRLTSNTDKLADRHFNPMGMYHVIMVYLQRLPGATKREILRDGRTVPRCIYTPHSIRATTATLLLGAGVDMRKVQDLLGHRHVTTTQIYDKRRIAVSESASHDVPI
jgi:integrase/recombinase XerC